MLRPPPTRRYSFVGLRVLALARAKYSQISSALTASSVRDELRAATTFPHPAPKFVDVQGEIVQYERKDGARLTRNLYLHLGCDSKRYVPLPVFV